MFERVSSVSHKALLIIEGFFNRIFSPRFNPLYYLGAIAFFFLWFDFLSGIYLLFYYRISVDDAYKSVEYITKNQWYLGGIMRSIHRYSSDGLMFAMLLHIVREFLNDRFRNWRWVAWVTGVVLMVTFWVEGVTGYWMVWDQRSQVVASISVKFLDFLPIFGEPLSRAFLSNTTVSNLLFIGVIFLHLSLPTLILIAGWMHLVRISRPVVHSPAALNKAIGIILIAACIIIPATSQLPADLGIAAARFGIDWFYLPLYPMIASLQARYAWLFTGAGIIVLTFLPWFVKAKRLQKAVVHLETCNGCELCFKDCPYEAIYMRKRTDGRPYEFEAVVAEKKCASCGFCVGACDFHAIDLPDRTEKDINREIENLLRFHSTAPKILVVVCGYGVQMKGFIEPEIRALKGMPDTRVMPLPCVAMLQPSMMEHAFKAGADGIFIAGCEVNDCHYREGNKWLEQRILNVRPPVVKKKNISFNKVKVVWLSEIHTKEFFAEIEEFADELKAHKDSGKTIKYRFMKDRLTPVGVSILTLAAVVTIYLSDVPYTFFSEKDALMVFSFKHSGKPSKVQEALPKAELEKLPRHMRPKSELVLKRFPVYAEVRVNGNVVMAKSFRPAGLWQNGSSFAFENIIVAPGAHRVSIKLSESNDTDRFDFTYEDTVLFKAGQRIAFDFDEKNHSFVIAK